MAKHRQSGHNKTSAFPSVQYRKKVICYHIRSQSEKKLEKKTAVSQKLFLFRKF